MQEYWEIYMKNVDGKPASILFNAGISVDIEKFKQIYSQIAFIKIRLKKPEKSGFLSKEEQKRISLIEDRLEASLIKFRIGKYVGRVFSDGYVTFLYYLQFTYNWQDFLNFALEEYQEYEITSGFQDDREWKYYWNLLYPNAKEWQIIQNHKACDILKSGGDSLKIPRAIEHRAFFGRNTQRDRLLSKLKERGFKIQEEITNKDGVKGLKFYRVDTPFYYDIDDLTLNLIEMLNEYNADYDGWECSVVKG